jgi:integrase
MAFMVPAAKYRGPQAQGFIVVWRDPTGVKRWKTCPTLRAAKEAQAQATREEAEPKRRPVVPARSTVATYSEDFLTVHGVTLKRRTRALYTEQFRRYILPAFGPRPVRQLTRGQIKRWLAGLRTRGLKRDTVRNAYAVLHVMLAAAVEDELIATNPASGLGRALKLLVKREERAQEVKAMEPDQLDRFLATMDGPEARPGDQRYLPFFLTLARTGLRIGEAFALMPEDLDLGAGILRVERNFPDGEAESESPKTVSSIRTVDLSPELVRVLRVHLADRARACLAHSWPAPWLFLSTVGTRLLKENIERVMRRLLGRADLPRHFTPHSLRHTFASLLLNEGENPKYVQQQLGHASLSMTIDLYGRWLRAKPTRGGVAALDRAPRGALPQPGMGCASGLRGVGAPANYWCAREGSNLWPPDSKSVPSPIATTSCAG